MTTIEQQIQDDRTELVDVVVRRALAGFWSWPIPVAEASDVATEPPRADRLQASVADRLLPYDTVRQAMLLISYLGVTFQSEDGERAVEALGMVMVHASVICTIERMSVVPVIELAEAFGRLQDVQPHRAAAALATAVMAAREMRANLTVGMYQRMLVEAMALAIANGIDDVVIGHDVAVKPVELFAVIAAEVIGGQLPRRGPRGQPTTMISKIPRPIDSGRRADAMATIVSAAGMLADQEASGLPLDRFGDPRPSAHTADANLSQEQGCPGSGAVPGLAHERICPQCAAPMSAGPGDIYRCSNGHEHTGMQIAALNGG